MFKSICIVWGLILIVAAIGLTPSSRQVPTQQTAQPIKSVPTQQTAQPIKSVDTCYALDQTTCRNLKLRVEEARRTMADDIKESKWRIEQARLDAKQAELNVRDAE